MGLAGYLGLLLLANGACLLGVLGLRLHSNRELARRARFDQRWRPVLLQWSLGNRVSLPDALPGQGARRLRRAERLWWLELWNDLQDTLAGPAGDDLNALLEQLVLRQDLAAMLTRPSLEAQMAAAQAFGHLQTREAWPDLVQLALQADSMLSFQALRTLLLIDAEAALPVMLTVLRAHRDWSRARLIATLQRTPARGLVKPLGAALQAALDSPDLDLAQDLLSLLGVLRYRRILPYLREVVSRAPSVPLSACALDWLAELQDLEAVPLIAALADDPASPLRPRALQALGQIDGAGQLPVLLRALEADDWWSVYRAVEALGRIPEGPDLAAHPRHLVREALRYDRDSQALHA